MEEADDGPEAGYAGEEATKWAAVGEEHGSSCSSRQEGAQGLCRPFWVLAMTADRKDAILAAMFDTGQVPMRELDMDLDELRWLESVVKFKRACLDKALALGPTVWKNWNFVADKLGWVTGEPNDKVYAALAYAGQPKAVGRSILIASERYVLMVSYRAMELSEEQLRKVLLHELVHIGYRGHGRDFRDVCREVGGVVSGSGVTDPGTHVEKKIGHRYKRVRTFDDPKEAEAWAREQLRLEPGSKWRLSFG